MDSVMMVEEWREKFFVQTPINPKVNIDPATLELLKKLLNEELKETIDGYKAGNIVEVFDGLCDMQYILDQFFCEFGLQNYKAAGVKEVHRSNMSKLGADGKPVYREDGKVLKGPNYFAPYLRAVLNGEIA